MARWGLPSQPRESSSVHQNGKATTEISLPLRLGAPPLKRELAPGSGIIFAFSIRANSAEFKVKVSPCLAAETIAWEVVRQGNVLFRHYNQAPATGRQNASDAYNVPMYAGYGARNRGKRQIPLPKTFTHPAEDRKALAFPGPGYNLPPSTASFAGSGTDVGEYRVRVRNIGQGLALFTIDLSTKSSSDAPILPGESTLAVKSLRPSQVTLEWQPALGAAAVEYCLEYTIASRMEKADVMNTQCGVDNINARQAIPATATGGQPSRQCTRTTQLTVANLFPATGYVMNIIARDVRTGKKAVYRGVWLKTSNRGETIQDGQELANYTLFPRSKQTFTFDLANYVTQVELAALIKAGRRLRISVVPCRGRVTWEVTKDGIPSQYFSPRYIDLDTPGVGVEESEEENFVESVVAPDMRSDRPSDQGGVMEAGRLAKRDEEPTQKPATYHQFEEDDDFFAGRFDGARPNIVRPLPPHDAGLGTSTGRTSYTYIDAPDRADNTYQITVYNMHHSEEASFTIRAELLVQDPKPKLPLDPQIRVMNVNSGHVKVNFLESKASRAGKDVQYCTVATPTSEIKPMTVMSSACNIQSSIPPDVLFSLKPSLPNPSSPSNTDSTAGVDQTGNPAGKTPRTGSTPTGNSYNGLINPSEWGSGNGQGTNQVESVTNAGAGGAGGPVAGNTHGPGGAGGRAGGGNRGPGGAGGRVAGGTHGPGGTRGPGGVGGRVVGGDHGPGGAGSRVVGGDRGPGGAGSRVVGGDRGPGGAGSRVVGGDRGPGGAGSRVVGGDRGTPSGVGVDGPLGGPRVGAGAGVYAGRGGETAGTSGRGVSDTARYFIRNPNSRQRGFYHGRGAASHAGRNTLGQGRPPSNAAWSPRGRGGQASGTAQGRTVAHVAGLPGNYRKRPGGGSGPVGANVPHRGLGSPFDQPAGYDPTGGAGHNNNLDSNNPAASHPVAGSNPFFSRKLPGTDPFIIPRPENRYFSPNEVIERPVATPFDTAPVTDSGSPFANPAAAPELASPFANAAEAGPNMFPFLQSTLSVQSRRMTCGRSTQPVLDNLEPGTEYAIEVVAIDIEAMQSSAYTSALIRTESQPIAPTVSMVSASCSTHCGLSVQYLTLTTLLLYISVKWLLA